VRGMAFSTDGNHRWCALDPRLGTIATVAESTLNLACVGARPSALVNCLNFGNPEHPEVMWQLSEAIDGMAEACLALDVPVVGGNVSLYNESRGVDIDPTPVVGTLGLVDSLTAPPPGVVLVDGQRIILVGSTAPLSLGGSRWAVQVRGHRRGRPAPVDLALHARLLPLVAGLVNDAVVGGVHDVSEGGLGVALAEMAVASGVGCRVGGLTGSGVAAHVGLFGEGPSRVLFSVADVALDELAARCAAADVPWAELGVAGGDRLVVEGMVDLGLDEVAAAAHGVLEVLGGA
jgi:phosphoribosylformylglycinamidine (FGAM) synthase-like enzyme